MSLVSPVSPVSSGYCCHLLAGSNPAPVLSPATAGPWGPVCDTPPLVLHPAPGHTEQHGTMHGSRLGPQGALQTPLCKLQSWAPKLILVSCTRA